MSQTAPNPGDLVSSQSISGPVVQPSTAVNDLSV